VIARPDVQVHERCSLDAFVVMACDGVWDVMTNEQVAAFVTERVHHHLSSSELEHPILPTVGDELLRYCYDVKGSKDNLSVVVAALSNVADRIANSSKPTAKALCFDPQS
jgi:protein phosphatase 1B